MIQRWGTVGLVCAALLGSCFPLLSGERFAFRDVNHFYLPLYDYVAARSSSEWLPMWNPLDHFGMPLVGETSTAVFYPLRWMIFATPLPNAWAMNVYLIVHLMIASCAAAWLAKRIGCDRTGVLVASLVYPLSGSVFSLCCNPPFLVGAAWIPFALGACLTGDPAGSHRRPLVRRCALASFALAMMILGGDPQAALHGAMVIFTLAVGRILVQGISSRLPGRHAGWSRISAAPKQTLWVGSVACALAAGIGAVQIAASADWSRQSDRVGVLERPDTYQFSLAPWHVAEVVSPRPFGTLFPSNRRVSRLIPGEGRMWTPSLYAGMVVGFALLVRLLTPRDAGRDPWFALAVVSFAFCLGNYGLVWWLQQIPGFLVDYDSAIGGPYWCLVQLIPGYGSFRYPVKWLPLFAIAGSMVTARWISTTPLRRERSAAAVLVVLFSFLAFAAHWASGMENDWWRRGASDLPADEYWGPLDVGGGMQVVRNSWVWSIILVVAIGGLRHVSASARNQTTRAANGSGKLLIAWTLLIGMDVSLTAVSLLPTVDIRREREVAHQVAPPPIPKTRTLRTQAGLWPTAWQRSASESRVLEVAASERVAWFGRWHLQQRQPVINGMVSIQSRRYGEFWKVLDETLAELPADGHARFWSTLRRWLAIEAVSHVDGSRSVSADGLSLVSVNRKRSDSIDSVRALTSWQSESTLSEIIDGIAHEGRVPVPHVASLGPPKDAAATIRRRSPQIGEVGPDLVRVWSESECLVERCVLQDGNWHANLVSVSGQRIRRPVHVSSHLNQAVLVPAGDWTIHFEYHPWWKWPAVTVMLASSGIWLTCVWVGFEVRSVCRRCAARMRPGNCLFSSQR